MDVQRAIDENRCRDIPLKECLETIERAYESKAKEKEKSSLQAEVGLIFIL
jgi:hypothetical protein